MDKKSAIKYCSEKIQKETREAIESVFTSQPDSDLRSVETHGRRLNSVRVGTITEEYDIQIGRVHFRARNDIVKSLKADEEKVFEDFIRRTTANIKRQLEHRISEFKNSFSNPSKVKIHFLIPDSYAFEFLCYEDRYRRGPFKQVFDMEISFGAYAEFDNEIVPYPWDNEEGLAEEALAEIREEKVIFRLAHFVRKEKNLVLHPFFNPEGYAEAVLSRFKKIAPSAILIFGDEISENKDYVRCKIDGTWEFSISNPSVSFEVKTDGTINVSTCDLVKEIY
ncbi:MAG: hypothetical protein M0R32_10090 [Candidatus Cloacimonetes bacterium]|jgi:hypothetical protein|nr:hypothetical protein [Candidatus Cloacimonadota bacterium]